MAELRGRGDTCTQTKRFHSSPFGRLATSNGEKSGFAQRSRLLRDTELGTDQVSAPRTQPIQCSTPPFTAWCAS